jgi:PAS domain S-box-containing protein
MDVVKTEHDYVFNLKHHEYDIIFADFTLPGFNGEAALIIAKELCPTIPFICISGTIGEDRAVELLKQGATDYVLKDRMERLPFATRRALDAAVQLNKFKNGEIELQTNRRLLQTIINNALDAIYIKDIHGKYLLFNAAAEKAFGKMAYEVIGKTDEFILSEVEVQLAKEIDQKVLSGLVPINFEESIKLSDGKVHTFHTIKSPMINEEGKVTGLFGIARDITEQKIIEKQLIIAKEKAEESNQLKTAFLANMSHEIRTPMNAVMGFSQLLADDTLSTQEKIVFSDYIKINGESLLKIIDDILDISTIDSKQLTIANTNFNLHTLLSELEMYYSSELIAKSKNTIKLELKLFYKDKKVFMVNTDEIRLKQILNNLLSNAIKYTDQGHIKFGYEIGMNRLHFYVQDTGVGIPTHIKNHVFDRFVQYSKKYIARQDGTGLGLSISKELVTLLGGELKVDSIEENGSTFYFDLPLNQHEGISEKTQEGRKLNTSIDLSDYSILIADDEESNFMLAKHVLAPTKINIDWATNGEEAVAMANQKKYDLIVMDIKMPYMNGFEATRLIKKTNSKTPIIIQTAFAMAETKNEALNAGCNDLIVKPFDLDNFLFLIKTYISKIPKA